jgi:feruloyl esterase
MRGLKIAFLFSAAAMGLAASQGALAQSQSELAKRNCEALVKAKTATFEVTETKATFVEAGPASPFAVPTTNGNVSTSFCRVEGVAKSNPASNIKFELWLPVKDRWNGRFAGTASGGSQGQIAYSTLAAHFRLNYASIAHDNGHVSAGYDQAWSYDPAAKSLKMELIIDWAYRAMHVVTVVGKELTSSYYGSPAAHAYYDGCSQSGHHGMMEVQRYPDDYDGVIAGAHTSEWTTNMSTQAWVAYQQFGHAGAGAIPKVSYSAVRAAILAKCDGKPGIDHLVDGVLDDPRKCTFDPVELQCKGGGTDAPACLKPAQVQSLRAMYQGYKTPAGEIVAYPYPVGAETGSYWPNNLTSPKSPQGSWADYFRYPAFVDPNYDFANFNFDTDPKIARDKLRPIYDAYSTDLRAFASRGGKLLMYHGWADSLISPLLTVDYWTALRQTMGSEEVGKFARLYMIPGVDHCGGGAGTGNFSMLDALANWVEKGNAPDGTNAGNTIVATGSADTHTRPLCPYPQIATYNGSGDVMSSTSFTCQAP